MAIPEGSDAQAKLLGELLREFREDRGIKQEVLASILGKRSQSFVAKIEQGSRKMGLIEFCEFAEAIGVDPLDLLQEFLKRTAQPFGHR